MAIADLGKNTPHSTDTYKSKVLSNLKTPKILEHAIRRTKAAHWGKSAIDLSEGYKVQVALPPKSGIERELIKSNDLNEETLAEIIAGNRSAMNRANLAIIISLVIGLPTAVLTFLAFQQDQPTPSEEFLAAISSTKVSANVDSPEVSAGQSAYAILQPKSPPITAYGPR